MDLLNLQGKITLDTSDYEKGINTAKKSAQEYKSDVMKLATQYKKSGMDMSEAMKKAYAEIDKSAYESGETAKDAADKTGDSWKDAAESLKGISGQLTSFANVFKGLAVVKGIQAVGSALLSLEESTEEYRIAQGKLNTAFEVAGYSAETAKDAYSGFYSILGDIDTATEASQLLAKLADDAEDVANWVDIAAGVYGTFGDSLPIEGLIESANETARVGEVTGVLADALNWVSIAEDDFNADLADCTSEAERNQLIMDTLAATYDDATDAFYENNEEIIRNRENQEKLDEALGNLGQSVSNVKNDLIDEYTPAVVSAANATADFLDSLETTVPKIESKLAYFQAFVQEIMTGSSLQDAMDTAARVAAYAGKEATGLPETVEPWAGPFNVQPTGGGKLPGSSGAKGTGGTPTVTGGGGSGGTQASPTLFEQLLGNVQAVESASATAQDVAGLQFDLWAAGVGKAASETETLAQKLKALKIQQQEQKEVVEAAQAAYDDYTASTEATEEESAQLLAVLLEAKIGYEELGNEIAETTKKYIEAKTATGVQTDALEEQKGAAEELKTAYDEVLGSVSALGSSISEVGDMFGSDFISNVGSFISTLSSGVSTILGLAESIQSVASAFGALGSVTGGAGAVVGSSTGSAGVLGGLGGISSIGSLAGGAGILGAVMLGVSMGPGLIEGAEKTAQLWADSNSSILDKILGTTKNAFLYATPIGGLFNLISKAFGFGDNDENYISDSHDTGAKWSTTTVNMGGITVQVNGNVDDPEMMAQQIAYKLGDMIDERVTVFA